MLTRQLNNALVTELILLGQPFLCQLRSCFFSPRRKLQTIALLISMRENNNEISVRTDKHIQVRKRLFLKPIGHKPYLFEFFDVQTVPC